ncbi:hypothetical protein [Bradyrhizobium sp. USDA 377]
MDEALLRVFGALGASTVTGGRLLLWACAWDARTSTDTNTTEPNIVALIAAALPNQRCFLSDKATPTNDDPQFRRTDVDRTQRSCVLRASNDADFYW